MFHLLLTKALEYCMIITVFEFYLFREYIGDENCLFLNVYTTSKNASERLPVIVWIHGGSFSRGSAAEYDPDYLLDEDVVLVTVQYRYSTVQYSTVQYSGWSRCSAGSACSASSPRSRRRRPATTGCWTRWPRCSGSSRTSR